LGFSYRVIQEAMASIGRCCLVEPRDMRRVFKYTEMYRRDMGIHRAPARRSRPYLILLNGNGNLSGFKWNKGYETCVTKRDLIRLLNDCLERRQFQSHVILTLYLYSDISVMDITQIRWRDVYNFGKGIFYSRITPANVPMSREMTQALLLYMARCPDVQPADYILTYQGKPLKSNTVFRRVRKAMSQLTDLRLARFGELRVWARQTLTAQPPRVPPKPHPFFSRINALQARANR
ncbi:MAG: hypothetical protein LBL26_04940, partial [Peptococcaceae bacterium]|nr:hypothetical protein [Peptococcaceae bacterium]